MLQQQLQTPQVSQSGSGAQGGYRDPPPTWSIDVPPVVLLREKLRQQSHVVCAYSAAQSLTLLFVLILLLWLQQGEDLRNVH